MKNMNQDSVEQYYEELQRSGNLSYMKSRDFTERELDFSCANGKGSWWLRTSSDRKTSDAHTVEAKGAVDVTQYVNGIYGIRPVIQIYYK